MKNRALAVSGMVLLSGLGGWRLLRSHHDRSNSTNAAVAAKAVTDTPAPRVPASVRKPAASGNHTQATAQPPQPTHTGAGKPASPLAQAVESIRRLEECYKSESCNFPTSDPRSYEIAIGQRLALELKTLRGTYREVPEAQATLLALARTYIQSSDGFVQEAALQILADMPPSRENLQALSDGIVHSPDATLIASALPELMRYIGQPNEPLVHQTLCRLMTEGSHFSSQAAARGVSEFLNPSSVASYREAAGRVPRETASSALLNSALNEYARKSTGG